MVLMVDLLLIIHTVVKKILRNGIKNNTDKKPIVKKINGIKFHKNIKLYCLSAVTPAQSSVRKGDAGKPSLL